MPCGQVRLPRRGRHRRSRPSFSRREWTGPKDGAVSVRKNARVVGDRGRDALAAAQPGTDELVGVGAVDLGARRAAGGAAGLAGDRQDPAGFAGAGVAVDQFAGAAVDVVGAAAQQNRLQAPSGVPDDTCGDRGGQRRYSSRRAWTSGGMLQPGGHGSVHRSAVLCRTRAWLELPAAQACHVVACAP